MLVSKHFQWQDVDKHPSLAWLTKYKRNINGVGDSPSSPFLVSNEFASPVNLAQ